MYDRQQQYLSIYIYEVGLRELARELVVRDVNTYKKVERTDTRTWYEYTGTWYVLILFSPCLFPSFLYFI